MKKACDKMVQSMIRNYQFRLFRLFNGYIQYIVIFPFWIRNIANLPLKTIAWLKTDIKAKPFGCDAAHRSLDTRF